MSLRQFDMSPPISLFYLRQRRRYRVNAFARVRLSIFLSVSKITQQELSYRKQIARQLRTQYVEGIYRPKYYTVTSKCGLEVTEGHWKWYHLKAWVGFLFAFHSNYTRIFSHFGYIQCQAMAWPLSWGRSSHWKWRGSTHHVWLYVSPPAIVTIALSCTICELFDRGRI